MLTHLLGSHVVDDPQCAHPGDKSCHVAMKSGAIREAIVLHLINPSLGIMKLNKVSPNPIFVPFLVNQSSFKRGRQPPTKGSFLFGIILDVFLCDVALTYYIMAARHGLID